MKNIKLNLFCFIVILSSGSLTAEGQIKSSCIGEWNIRCPDITEGFDSGILKIGPDSVYSEYPGFRHSFTSRRVEVRNDTLYFNVDIMGQPGICKVKSENSDILNGFLMVNDDSFLIVLVKSDLVNKH